MTHCKQELPYIAAQNLHQPGRRRLVYLDKIKQWKEKEHTHGVIL